MVAAWAQVGEPVWEDAAAHAAAVDARVAGIGELTWQEVGGQLAEAGAGWELRGAVPRYVRQPDGAWPWDSETWLRLLRKVARFVWVPPWELVVAPPAARGDSWEGPWPGEAEDEPDAASPRQLAEELWDLSELDLQEWNEASWEDALYWGSVGKGQFEEEARSGWCMRGQHDAGALALIDVLDRAVGRRPARPLTGPMLIGRSAGWWWPFERVVILTERPCALDLARDEQGRLHHPTGPLVGYPDGWGIWAWHGVRVPRQVIEQPETITVDQIRGTRNLETRRVLLERYGLDRYLRDAEAALMQVDGYGKLWRAELPDDEPLTIVEVVNATAEPDGTYASYLLRVPPTMSTARQAVAWTFGMAADDYHPVVQT
jgi:hypothetical protein